MSDYTVMNLKQDVDDQAPGFGLSPSMEARFATRSLELENGGVGYERLEPGFRVPFGHRHKEQEEVYVILSGSARLKLDDEILELKPWDVVRIPKGTMRCLEAGPDGVENLAFGAPHAGPSPMDEVEMEPGWWSD
jgi:mannose-6-phosphate isomerase-like protein (cupin superfamily)